MNGQSQKKPLVKSKVALGWAILVINIVVWTVLGFWCASKRAQVGGDVSFGIGFSIGMVVIGGFFVMAGAVGYFIVLFTEAGTFNYAQPVWKGFKVRLYLANIFVPLSAMLGVGFILCAVVTPFLANFGLSGPAAYMAPVLGAVVILQLVLIWVRVWTPLTKRLINKRLRARGLNDLQLAGGMLIGISDPSRSSFKKFGAVEDDVGMLWLHPDQLIYWGDNDQFSVRLEQLLEIERSMDTGGTSSLSGTIHVILRVAQADGTERRIRLHTEGNWTLGAARAKMEELAQRVEAWRTVARSPIV